MECLQANESRCEPHPVSINQSMNQLCQPSTRRTSRTYMQISIVYGGMYVENVYRRRDRNKNLTKKQHQTTTIGKNFSGRPMPQKTPPSKSKSTTRTIETTTTGTQQGMETISLPTLRQAGGGRQTRTTLRCKNRAQGNEVPPLRLVLPNACHVDHTRCDAFHWVREKGDQCPRPPPPSQDQR